MLCYGCGVSLVVVVEGLRRAAYVFGINAARIMVLQSSP